MSRTPSAFRKGDVRRAVEAAIAAGVEVRSVEVDKDGRITVIAGKPALSEHSEDGNPWDAATASGGSASIGDAEELIRILAWALVEHRVSLASVTPSQTGFGSCPAVHDPDACSCRGDVLEVLVRSPDEATMRAALASVLLPP